MENCLKTDNIYNRYEEIEHYEMEIEHVILDMLSKNQRIIFAHIAERAGVTRFVVRHYPDLRDFILQRMKYYEEIQVINKKIDQAVISLQKSKKSITFMSILNRCKFDSIDTYQNQLIKDKIRSVLIECNK